MEIYASCVRSVLNDLIRLTTLVLIGGMLNGGMLNGGMLIGGMLIGGVLKGGSP